MRTTWLPSATFTKRVLARLSYQPLVQNNDESDTADHQQRPQDRAGRHGDTERVPERRGCTGGLAAVVLVMGLSACAYTGPDVIVGDGYRIHVTSEAPRMCNEAWELFPYPAPLMTQSCAIMRTGFEGDALLGEIFLPAADHCVGVARPIQWMVSHEERRCRERILSQDINEARR